jgi:DNA-binding MarR family transcriptional regulator
MKIPGVGSPAEVLTRRLFTRIIAAVARALREHELSVGQVAVLYLLDERKTLRVTDVANELELGLPTASRLVDDLVRDKLVAREEDPNDRRARLLTLTPQGHAFIEESSKARMQTIVKAAAEMPSNTIAVVLSKLPLK